MKQEVLNYIKSLSNKENEQELLIDVLEKILIEQENFKEFIKINEEKIINIKNWVISMLNDNQTYNLDIENYDLEILNNLSNEYFLKKNNIVPIAVGIQNEKVIADLGEYYIVQMLTPEALDNESKQMQHCIGQLGYDQKVKNQYFQYFSLRDKLNKSYVTLEISENRVIQLQGKKNTVPEGKYLELLVKWLDNNNIEIGPNISGKYFDRNNMKLLNSKEINLEKNIDFIENINIFGMTKIVSGNEKFLFKNKYNLEVNGIHFTQKNKKIVWYNEEDLKNKVYLKKYIFKYLSNNGYKNIPYVDLGLILNKIDNKVYQINNMPENCEIDDSLDLYLDGRNIDIDNIIILPKNLTINGDAYFNGYEEQGKNVEKLHVKGNVEFNKSEIDNIDNMILEKDIIFYCSNIKKLPDNLTVNGNLILHQVNIKELPNNLSVNGSLDINISNLTKINNSIIKGNLNILNCENLKELSESIYVEKNLDISCSKIEKITENIRCNKIIISVEQLDLINENMNFESVCIKHKNVEDEEYKKDEFFERFKQPELENKNLSFTEKVVNLFNYMN